VSQRNTETVDADSVLQYQTSNPSTWENFTIVNNGGNGHPNWDLYNSHWGTSLATDESVTYNGPSLVFVGFAGSSPNWQYWIPINLNNYPDPADYASSG